MSRPPLPYEHLPEAPSFTLVSEDIAEGATVPLAQRFDGMDVGGQNLSPHLDWSAIDGEDWAGEVKSFAITCYDPDAPTGSGFWHWVLYDIGADVRSISAGAGGIAPDGSASADLPAGAKHGRSDFGSPSYGGSAPPPGHGDHRYVFVVHALSCAALGVPDDATSAYIGFNMTFNTVARGQIVATFGR